MAIVRTVETITHCDICGQYISGWSSTSTGVSIQWAKYHIRQQGASTGEKIKCKDCRIKECIKKCALIKKYGSTNRQAGKCVGFESNDEPYERCQKCIAHID